VIARAALLFLALGCAAPYEPPQEPTQAEWNDGLRRLATLRDALPKRPYTQPITVELSEPYTRRRFEGRGAVGVDPGRAMRMILVGPAGEPALDVWVTRDAWRMVVPAIHLVRRGGRDAPASMPIGFFRSWFVDPLGGHLLALGREGELVVRDDAGGTLHVTDARAVDGETSARVRRRAGESTESFAYVLGRAGGEANYTHENTRLSVAVKLGAIQPEPPEPDAFVDPDKVSAR